MPDLRAATASSSPTHSAAIDAERRLRDLARNAKRGVEAFRVELEQNVASHLIGPGASRLTEIEALAKRRFFLEGKAGVPVDHFKVKAEGKLADIAPKAPVEEGAEIRLELVEVGQHDIAAGVGKLDGLTISVADGSKLVGKKVKVRIERVLNGAAYATLVQTAAQTAKMDAPITAESEAEKPTRAPRKKKVEERKPDARRPVPRPGGEGRGRAEGPPTERRCRPPTRRAESPRRRPPQRRGGSKAEEEDPPRLPRRAQPPEEAGCRGGRRERQTDEAPTPATIHVPSPELGQTTDGAERGRRAAAQEEANAPRLARRPQPAQEARSRFDRGQNRVVKNKGPAEWRGPCPGEGLALRSRDDLVRAVVPVLLGVEEAPVLVLEQVRVLRSEEPVHGRVPVGDVRARDLVVAVVLAEAAGRGVDRRRRVTALGQPANRLVRRVGVVRVTSKTQPESSALRCPCSVSPASSTNVIRSCERNADVVEAGPRPVAAVEDRQSALEAPGLLWLSLKTEHQPPSFSFSGLVAFVSPVSSK